MTGKKSVIFGVIAAVIGLGVVISLGCGRKEATVGPAATAPTPARERIVIGRVPSGNVLDISERMDPLVALMKNRLGVDVQVKFATDYDQFTRNMESGEYDLAFCAPFQYINAHEKAGYDAILRPIRNNSDTYVGIFITTRPDITSLAQLRGKRIAFADPGSTSGYIFPLGLLATVGITTRDIQSFFLKGHDNVVLNVLSGAYDAGACFETAERIYGKERAGELRIIGRTEPIYNEPIAVSPKFRADRAELTEKVIRFMTGLQDSQEGQNVIKRYGDGVSRFVAATDTEYNSIRMYAAKLPPEIIAGSGH